MYLYREIGIKMHGGKREEGENGNAAFHSESSVQADPPICGSIEKGIWNEPCFIAGEQFHRMMRLEKKVNFLLTGRKCDDIIIKQFDGHGPVAQVVRAHP